ncbi:MAG: aspartate aminotransferase family protein [Chloroflexi bacterium]|nr:aspartate aminotransferase family protein [Chloroflexota bacterium]
MGARRTTKSKRAFARLDRYIAGGSTRGGVLSGSYPIFLDHGEGCSVYDADGNRYIDFINASFALPFGHNFAPVRRAIASQVTKGTFFTAHNETETELARLLCERVPSIERLKFCNSGTEATMFAARAARALTGRMKLAKMAGGFHGTNDVLSTGLGLMSGGIPDDGDYNPVKQAAIGIPPAIAGDVVLLSFNNPTYCEAVIERHKKELAAVFVEPVMGAAGMIPPREGFLQFLREITKRYGIFLIFDEMISMGIARGGAQEYYGVTPDMTCCGKIIGGGMPIGCLGGSEAVMAVFDRRKRTPIVNHGGTFAGHPLSMAAGAAQLRAMTPAVYRRLHHLGDLLRSRLRAMIAEVEAPIQVTGVGQLFAFHVARHEVYNYETAWKGDAKKAQEIIDSMTKRGIFQTRTTRGAVSYPMTESHIEAYATAMREAIIENGLAGG